MRAHFLTSAIPAVLLLAACGQPSEVDTAADAPEADAAPPAEVAAASPPPPAEPEPEPEPSAEPEPAVSADMEQALASLELRQGLMKLTAWNMGPLGGMLRGNVEFDAERAALNTTRIADLSVMIADTFEPDLRGMDLETEALDAIWDNKDDFDAKAAALTDAARAAAEAAESGDQSATMAALAGVGQSCGGCHDDYRAD